MGFTEGSGPAGLCPSVGWGQVLQETLELHSEPGPLTSAPTLSAPLMLRVHSKQSGLQGRGPYPLASHA